EEERLVADERSAVGAAVLVPGRVRLRLQQRRPRRQRVPLVTVEQAVVPRVRAALGDDVEVAGHRHAVLGGDHALDDLHLADRLDADDVDLADAVVLRELARPGVAAGVGAVGGDAHRRAAEAVQPQPHRAVAALDRVLFGEAGADRQDVRDVTVRGRQVLDLERLDVDALLGRQGVDERRLTADGDVLLDAADFELVALAYVLRRAELHARALVTLEAAD